MDPVAAVHAAMQAGARTRKEIAAVSGLDSGLVDVTLDVLLRSGGVEVHALKFECGAGGCRNCVQDATCAPQVGGPVAVQIRRVEKP